MDGVGLSGHRHHWPCVSKHPKRKKKVPYKPPADRSWSGFNGQAVSTEILVTGRRITSHERAQDRCSVEQIANRVDLSRESTHGHEIILGVGIPPDLLVRKNCEFHLLIHIALRLIEWIED
jgi:hypothetical protein